MQTANVLDFNKIFDRIAHETCLDDLKSARVWLENVAIAIDIDNEKVCEMRGEAQGLLDLCDEIQEGGNHG